MVQEVQARLMKAELDPEELSQYEIRGGEADFDVALGGAALKAGGRVSVKGTPREAARPAAEDEDEEEGGGKGSGKKRKGKDAGMLYQRDGKSKGNKGKDGKRQSGGGKPMGGKKRT